MSKIEDRPYTHFERFKPHELERERQCFCIILSAMPSDYVPRVSLELFGGVGLFLSLVPPEWATQRYYVWDHDNGCVVRLRKDHPHVIAMRVDSFTHPFPMGVKFISADFNSFTLLRWCTVPRYRKIMDRIFQSGAEYIQVTDSAINKLHINRSSYEKFWPEAVSGRRCIETIDDYVEAFSDYAFRMYKYRVIRGAYHHGASYLLLQRGARKCKITMERVV